jgi:integrase
MPSKITVSTISSWLRPIERPLRGERRVVRRVVPGLDLHIGAEGPGRWIARVQLRGAIDEAGRRAPPRSVKLGDTNTLALHEAIAAHNRLKLRVLNGEDPSQDRRAAAEARKSEAMAARAVVACRELLDPYRELLAGRRLSERHVRDEIGHTTRALELMNSVDIAPALITPSMVDVMLSHSPAGSRRARFASLNRFLTWALRRDGAAVMPPTMLLARHERPKPVAPRQRVLTRDELSKIWAATDTLPGTVGRDLVQLLIVVPARINEAGAMHWRDVDMPGATWTQPTSKNGKPFKIPLNAPALEILRRRQWIAGGAPKPDALVFTAARGGQFRAWSVNKALLDKRTGIADWRLHDFRRAFGTHMGEFFDEALIDLSLNHSASVSRSGVTGVYNLAQRWGERVVLMQRWAEFLWPGQDGDNVVTLPSAESAA